MDSRAGNHIVEQNPTNKAQFTAEQLQNTDNIVALPKDVHQSVSSYYSSKIGGSTLTVRQSVSQMPFDEQGVCYARRAGRRLAVFRFEKLTESPDNGRDSELTEYNRFRSHSSGIG